MPEHGGHHDTHDCEDEKSGEEELWSSPDVDEVAAHEYPGFGEEGVGEFPAEMVVGCGGVWVDDAAVSYVVVFVDGVVAAVGCWGAL